MKISSVDRKRDYMSPRIDVELIAFLSDKSEYDLIIECMITAIVSKCIMEYGQPPIIL